MKVSLLLTQSLARKKAKTMRTQLIDNMNVTIDQHHLLNLCAQACFVVRNDNDECVCVFHNETTQRYSVVYIQEDTRKSILACVAEYEFKDEARNEALRYAMLNYHVES
jgi:hypothetical protein